MNAPSAAETSAGMVTWQKAESIQAMSIAAGAPIAALARVEFEGFMWTPCEASERLNLRQLASDTASTRSSGRPLVLAVHPE